MTHRYDIKVASNLAVGDLVLLERSADGYHWPSVTPSISHEFAHVIVHGAEEVSMDDLPDPERERFAGASVTTAVHLRFIDGDVHLTAYVPVHFTLRIPRGDHHPVCGRCGEVWPCREDRITDAGERLRSELDDLCAHCGRPINGAWSTSFHDGVMRRRYHTAKKYAARGLRCRDAAAEAQAAAQADSVIAEARRVLGE